MNRGQGSSGAEPPKSSLTVIAILRYKKVAQSVKQTSSAVKRRQARIADFDPKTRFVDF
jgi:hypothetical protein